MRFSKRPIKSALSALLFTSILAFTGCSNLGTNSTSSVTLKINTARAADSKESELFIDVTLSGDYEKTQTAALTDGKETTITFDGVPVGKQVFASAEIYMNYGEDKLVVYSGKSESKEIAEENNTFSIKLETQYDSIAKTESSIMVLKPLFTSENNNETLAINKLDFNSESETFAYKIENLGSYQKAIVTIKGAADGEHAILPKFIKSSTAALYKQDEITVTAVTQDFELPIPQGIRLDAIGFENSWTDDYSCVIEKIELVKDASLIEPEFNVITKTSSTYTVKNPAMQILSYSEIENNMIRFKASLSEDPTNTYSAAYWEPYDTDLGDYDKITITYSLTAPEKSFRLNGYLPRDYSTGRNVDKHSNDDSSDRDRIETHSLQETKSLDLRILTNALEAGEFKAIEFKYDGTDSWDLQIQEIKLEKTGTFNLNISLPDTSDISVTTKIGGTTQTVSGVITITTDTTIEFTADEGYTTYTWKLNGEEPKIGTVSGSVFSLNSESLTNQVYNISLFADDTVNDRHHSWTAEIKKQ